MQTPRKPSNKALQEHAKACKKNEFGYLDPETGLFVMTSVYLQTQGSCCGSGCRHCPWDAQAQTIAGRDPELPTYPWTNTSSS